MKRRLALLALLVAGSSLAAASGAASRGGAFPTYVSADGHWALVSNGDWKVGSAPASQVRPYSNGVTTYDGAKSSLVWARACAAGRQSVRFERTLTLPGPPPRLQFVVFGPQLQSVQLLVNHRLAAQVAAAALATANTQEVELGQAQRALVRDGENVVDVVAVKKANPPRVRTCDAGIGFGLDATSQAALAVTQPRTTMKYARGPILEIGGAITIVNNGPSAAIDGAFGLTVQPTGLDLVFLPAKASGGLTCTPPQGQTLTCTFANLAPGASATVDATVRLSWQSDQSTNQVLAVSERWGASAKDAATAPGSTASVQHGVRPVRRLRRDRDRPAVQPGGPVTAPRTHLP